MLLLVFILDIAMPIYLPHQHYRESNPPTLSIHYANAKNKEGETALHYAASQGHNAVVRALLTAREIKVNVRSNRKTTPLLLAAYGGHMEVTRLLTQFS
jgi:ankyrin repeat protein